MRGLLLWILSSGACASSPGPAPPCSESLAVGSASPLALTPERVPSAFQRARPRELLLAEVEALERLINAIDSMHQDYADVRERAAAGCFELYLAEVAADDASARAALARGAAHLASVSLGGATQDAARLYLRGLVLEQTGALSEARDAYSAAVRVGGGPSDMARVHHALGLHAMLAGEEQRARAEFERASELVLRAPGAPHERLLARAIDERAAALRSRRGCGAKPVAKRLAVRSAGVAEAGGDAVDGGGSPAGGPRGQVLRGGAARACGGAARPG